ncbi:MAG: class I SAM-dependent methyltransferase [Acidimicrobiia bacterium]|nr:class I SAM-dependent methyltransferase [Acidimicrobiia bacterium]
MPSTDAERWNARYQQASTPRAIEPHELVALQLSEIGEGRRVLDVACGLGDAGLSLAKEGCDVTFVDVSEVALDAVARRAEAESLTVETLLLDLANEPLPDGPWDIIVCVHYLDRALLARFGSHLATGGVAVIAIATSTNLERHERPSARFLLDADELPSLLPDLHAVRHDEEWRSNGSHEAWLVATTR